MRTSLIPVLFKNHLIFFSLQNRRFLITCAKNSLKIAILYAQKVKDWDAGRGGILACPRPLTVFLSNMDKSSPDLSNIPALQASFS